MLFARAWHCVSQYGGMLQHFVGQEVEQKPAAVIPTFAFSEQWQVLGPFQIGTREAVWGADPLEYYGGFHTLEYNDTTSFKSSLVPNGTVSWSSFEAKLSDPDDFYADAELSVTFPEIDWPFLQDVYGWAALQWQGWARGEIYVQSSGVGTKIFHAQHALEFWIDDEHYFGGDLYGFGRAPVTLHLEPGRHRIDVRLVRDVRAMGGVGEPSIDVKLQLETSYNALFPLMLRDDNPSSHVLISDMVGGIFGPLASSYASVTLRNDALRDAFVTGIEPSKDRCEAELVHSSPIKIIPGQSRPVAFRIACIPPINSDRINLDFKYLMNGDEIERFARVSTWPAVYEWNDPHKVTFMHSAGVVSYAVLRAPPSNAQCNYTRNDKLPILLQFHGAGVEVDGKMTRHSLDPLLQEICAWVLIPTGGTPWSGDDWHVWGFADVEAAIAAIPQWMEQVEWDGPGVDLDRWLVSGHSNGGQGAWYALTHKPDKVIAAAPVSGYSSIQNYVPYTFWHTADPGKTAVLQASLNNYRHELLLENAKDIPILQQHGSEDDNVPTYHSRMLSQRLQQAGVESTYVEIHGQPHWWEGVMYTEPLSNFYRRHLHPESESQAPLDLREFTVVSAGQGDMGSKNGVEILQLVVPGQLSRIQVTFDPLTLACAFRTTNVRSFRLPMPFRECSAVKVDGQALAMLHANPSGMTLSKDHNEWLYGSSLQSLPERRGSQLGPLNAILRTRCPHSIFYHSPAAKRVALQISRNLFQYYGADAKITHQYKDVERLTGGNLITVAIGLDLPSIAKSPDFPIEVTSERLQIRDSDGSLRSYPVGCGLLAIWLQPAPGERLELVVWGSDAESLDIAARLVPLLTGTGQPDFVIADKTMLWKGLEGTLALGFLDADWNVSTNSYLS